MTADWGSPDTSNHTAGHSPRLSSSNLQPADPSWLAASDHSPHKATGQARARAACEPTTRTGHHPFFDFFQACCTCRTPLSVGFLLWCLILHEVVNSTGRTGSWVSSPPKQNSALSTPATMLCALNVVVSVTLKKKKRK